MNNSSSYIFSDNSIVDISTNSICSSYSYEHGSDDNFSIVDEKSENISDLVDASENSTCERYQKNSKQVTMPIPLVTTTTAIATMPSTSADTGGTEPKATKKPAASNEFSHMNGSKYNFFGYCL